MEFQHECAIGDGFGKLLKIFEKCGMPDTHNPDKYSGVVDRFYAIFFNNRCFRRQKIDPR
jgi:hypothetical protein